jgi:DNA-binding transcriptional ArsR family regulator
VVEVDFWRLLHVFQSKVRVEIVKLLLRFAWISLSEISQKLREESGVQITLPGLLKHMRELEEAGIVRHESGVFAEKPDARKTRYIVEGKERVEKIMQHLEHDLKGYLVTGVIFSEASKLARKIQGMGSRLNEKEMKRFEVLLNQCESESFVVNLTDDEKKKIKLWRIMIRTLL